MNIQGLWAVNSFDQYSLNKQSLKSRSDEAAFSFKDEKQSANGKTDPAKIAASEPSAGSTVRNAPTANTLWQTQSYAQSEDSEAIDIEETASVKKKTVVEEFLEHMNKTPEELLREEVLKSLGYTEESLAAMDPKERIAAEAKIKEAIETKIEQAIREKGIDIDGAKSLSVASV